VTRWLAGLSRGRKVALAGATLVVIIAIVNVLAPKQPQNTTYKPQDEFKLDPWINLKVGGIDLSINKAVFYLLVACALTTWAMVYIAKRMERRPNNVQTAVEAAYDLAFNNIARGNMDPGMAAKWFPFIGALFFFILFSNMIGYLPLPTNTEHSVHILGAKVPSLALYAATANISVPATIPLFVIEAISHFVRIISLSVRLFANMLAGHLLILFMGGGMVVLLGAAAIGPLTVIVAVAFFLFEVGIVAGLQAFIFATLTSIYLGGATAEAH
jgi:F-type H+-transporting ATPase subunit a